MPRKDRPVPAITRELRLKMALGRCKSERTRARLAQGLLFAEAMLVLGVKATALAKFESGGTECFASEESRAAAAQIYGKYLKGVPAKNARGQVALKPCGACGTTVSWKAKFGTAKNLPAVPGVRFCSYRCRRAYQGGARFQPRTVSGYVPFDDRVDTVLRRSRSEVEREREPPNKTELARAIESVVKTPLESS